MESLVQRLGRVGGCCATKPEVTLGISRTVASSRRLSGYFYARGEMKYPLYNLRVRDVQEFIARGAVRCSVFLLGDTRGFVSAPGGHNFVDRTRTRWDYLVYFWDAAGNEIGYATKMVGCGPEFFESPRKWSDSAIAAQEFFDISELEL